jgi:hypothetical protein
MTGMSEIPIRRPFLWRKQYYPKEMTKITYKGHEFDFDAVVNLMGFNDRLVGTPRPALPPDDCMMAAIVAPVGARNIDDARVLGVWPRYGLPRQGDGASRAVVACLSFPLRLLARDSIRRRMASTAPLSSSAVGHYCCTRFSSGW